MTVEALPYWLVNLPREEWPEACPEYLVNVDPRDREILGTHDADYHTQTWEEVVELASMDPVNHLVVYRFKLGIRVTYPSRDQPP